MKLGRVVVPFLCVLALLLPPCVADARAEEIATSSAIQGSPLALRSVPADPARRLAGRFERASGTEAVGHEDWLAQRVITREWGASDDTSYVEIEVPGYRSEGWALLLSSIVPGTGELYVGEGSGWVALLAEAGAWTARVILDRQADRHQQDAARWAGSPYDPASRWNFARWAEATQGDTLALQQLYAGDRDAFYHRIGDQRYRAGWGNETDIEGFLDLQSDSRRFRRRVTYANGTIILLHLASALDALHAAREHNVPLQQNLRLKLGGTIDPSGESMAFVAGVERRF